MRAALAVSILAALLAEGSALLCYHCESGPDESCKGEWKQCPSTEDSCLTKATEATSAVMTGKVLQRQCGNSRDCNQVYSLTHFQGNIRIATTCCKTDKCTPPQPAVPPDSTKKNGVSCPWCGVEGSALCSTQENIGCTGDEKKCIHYTADAGGFAFHMRGCATESMCNTTGIGAQILGAISSNVDLRCTDGGSRAENVLFLPVLAGLALLTIF